MVKVSRTASRVAWSASRQSAFGAPLSVGRLDRFLRLKDPLILKPSLEHWSDRGNVGAGHDWETQRGLLRQHVEFELPEQPLPVGFVAFLLALFFSGESATTNASGVYEHVSAFPSLQSVSEAAVTSLALHEDGQDWLLQDVACVKLSLKGEGSERLSAGGSFVASRLVGPLGGFTWPATAAQRYLYNYAGAFSLAGADRHPQLRSFSLSLENGLKTDQAWRGVASEADRIYPSLWPLTAERKMGLSLSLSAEAGDLIAFRSAYQNGSASAINLSVLGETISGSNPVDSDELALSVPHAVFTGLEYNYGDGVMGLELSVEGAYDNSCGGPLRVTVTEGSTARFMDA
ncbi:hypothetical protein LLH00_12230 [bacterium]|nr:hypothetical protein [bacterium]